MYKIVSREDTIRIPAEYMRKGASLNDHIDRLSMTAFEGRFDEENRFILLTTNHEPLGRGRIIHGDGAIYQRVRFDAVLFCMEDYEVVEGAVSEVNEFGAFVRIGPMEALLHKSQIMDDMVDTAGTLTKAAEVRLIGREFVGGGYVTVLVRGETGAVNAAVRAGADACERVGDGLVAAHIIARPHREVEPALNSSAGFVGSKD